MRPGDYAPAGTHAGRCPGCYSRRHSKRFPRLADLAQPQLEQAVRKRIVETVGRLFSAHDLASGLFS